MFSSGQPVGDRRNVRDAVQGFLEPSTATVGMWLRRGPHEALDGWRAMDVDTATADGALRWSRACVLAVVALLTGAVAHASAGETLPAPGTLLLLLALVTCAVGPLLRHEASTRRVVLLLVAGESFIHVALASMSAGPGHGPAGSAPGMSPMAVAMGGMPHTQAPVPRHGLLAVSGWLGQGLSEGTAQHALMAEAHMAAAAFLGLWLAAGEHALWTLLCLTLRPVTTAVSLLMSRSRCLVPDCVWDETCAAATDRDQHPPGLSVRACDLVTRRGPPLGSSRLLCA